MLIYAVVLGTCLLLLMGAHFGSAGQRRQITLLCVFGLTFFAAMRGLVGTDTYAYHTMFTEFGDENLSDIILIVEPMFAALIKVTALLSDDPFVFTALIGLIQGFLLAQVVATSKHPLDFLLIYATIFYLSFHFNILRAGTAILLLILAMRIPKEDKNQSMFYVFGVTAILFHYSAIIGFLPLLIFRLATTRSRAMIVALLVSFLAFTYYAIPAGELVPVRYLAYADILAADASSSISLSLVLGLPLYLMLYISAVNRANLFVLTLVFVVWLAIRWLTSVFSLVGRVEVIINSLLLFSIIEFALTGWRYKLRKVAIIGLTVMWFAGSLVGLKEESAILDNLGVTTGIYSMSPYVPYKFIWDEN